MGAWTLKPHSGLGSKQERRVLSSAGAAAAVHGPNVSRSSAGGWQERLRLGYVAMTRAKHQLCLDWGRIKTVAPACGLVTPSGIRQLNAEQPWQAIAEHINKPAIYAWPCSNAAMSSALRWKSSTQTRHRLTALPNKLVPWPHRWPLRGGPLAAGDVGVTAGCMIKAKP